MVIATFEHVYSVISVRKSTPIYNSYICRNTGDGSSCYALAVRDRRYFEEITGRISDTVNKSVFTDFLESFVCNDQLCIVMRHRQGISLEAKLATEAMTLAERLEIGRKILEKIILQEIPAYFLAKCSSTKNIIIGNDLSVYFNYPLEDILDAGKYNNALAMACMTDVLRELFASELERKAPSVLMRFFNDLPALAEKGSVPDVYCAYSDMTSKISGDEAGEEPKTFWYMAWEKIKTGARYLRKILMAVLLLAALGFLFYAIVHIGPSTERSHNFNAIGTVDIY